MRLYTEVVSDEEETNIVRKSEKLSKWIRNLANITHRFFLCITEDMTDAVFHMSDDYFLGQSETLAAIDSTNLKYMFLWEQKHINSNTYRWGILELPHSFPCQNLFWRSLFLLGAPSPGEQWLFIFPGDQLMQ